VLRGREAARPKLRAASHLLLLLGVGGQRHRVSRLECDLGLFPGHLGVPQRPRMLKPSHSRRVASPSSDLRRSHHSWHIPTPPGIDSNDDDPRLQRAQGRSTNRVLAPPRGPPEAPGGSATRTCTAQPSRSVSRVTWFRSSTRRAADVQSGQVSTAGGSPLTQPCDPAPGYSLHRATSACRERRTSKRR
jgi:hypothetical protein